MGASNSSRIGWFINMSLLLIQSPLTSYSVKLTCFPGRHLKNQSLEGGKGNKSGELPSNFQQFVNDVIDVDVLLLVFYHMKLIIINIISNFALIYSLNPN